MIQLTYRALKILVVSVIGATLIVFGIVLLVTPGPGWLLIFSGLGVLAIEFVWARRLLKSLKRTVQGVATNVSAASSDGGRGFKIRARASWRRFKRSMSTAWARITGRSDATRT